MPSVVRPIPAEDLKNLFDQIVFLFTGRRSCARPDQSLLKEIRKHLRIKEVFSSLSLADLCGLNSAELKDQFKRMTEFNLETWLLHQRIMLLFDRLENLDEMSEDAVEALSRQSGIAGSGGLDRLFNDLFGIPYKKWVSFSTGSVILTDHRPEFFCFM
jgi:AraC-like DNA-binding protein